MWIVLALNGLVACQGDDDEPEFCPSLCSRVSACGAGDGGACLQGCEQYRATTPVSAEVLDGMAPCVANASCGDIESGGYFAACWDEGTAGVEPSSAVIETCTEITANEFACGLDADLGVCVDSAKAYKPEFIMTVLDCSRRSCAEIITCYTELSE